MKVMMEGLGQYDDEQQADYEKQMRRIAAYMEQWKMDPAPQSDAAVQNEPASE